MQAGDGVIDRSETRDIPWDPAAHIDVVPLIGTRAAKPISASGQSQPHKQAGHMDANEPITAASHLAARGPSTYGSRLFSPLVRACGRDDGK